MFNAQYIHVLNSLVDSVTDSKLEVSGFCRAIKENYLSPQQSAACVYKNLIALLFFHNFHLFAILQNVQESIISLCTDIMPDCYKSFQRQCRHCNTCVCMYISMLIQCVVFFSINP